jgi:hypothetical protein
MKRRSDGEDWIMGPSLNRFCARWNLESAVVAGRFALEPDRKRQALLANRTHGTAGGGTVPGTGSVTTTLLCGLLLRDQYATADFGGRR